LIIIDKYINSNIKMANMHFSK